MSCKLLPHMLDDQFLIYVDRLQKGDKEKIDYSLDPIFLEIVEAELDFRKPVILRGECYLAEDELILHLEIETEASLPCAICNEGVQYPIHLRNFYYAEPLERIKAGKFDFKEIIRGGILLEVPLTAECGGDCPKRQELLEYFSEGELKSEGSHPFADL